MENEIDVEKFRMGFNAIAINIFVNDYALERVGFGFEKIGERVPVEKYLDDLKIPEHILPDLGCIPGLYIDEQMRISDDQDRDAYVHDLFVRQMDHAFFYAPKDLQAERKSVEIPLLPRFREYVFGLLPTFSEILNTEVGYEFFDTISTDRAARAAEYEKWSKFVTAILLKPLRAGSRINRYVEDIKNAPYYIKRLIEKKGKNFYLKTADINSTEYILALFSLTNFMNPENNALWELKLREWERLHE